MNSKISIIVPIYNAEKFLDKCIKSIINQTYSNLEIILVNDGSTDNSLNICKKYAGIDNRIHIIDKENGGVSSARNRGIDLASGDYIGFVDSDDFITTKMYEKLLFAISEANADIAECGYFRTDLNYEIIDLIPLENEELNGNYDCSHSFILKKNTTDFCFNKLYKKFIFEDIRYPNFKYSEDYVLNVKAFYNCSKKVTISDCCYYYVNNLNSAVHQDFNQSKLDIIHAGEEVLKFYKDKFTELNNYVYIYILENIIQLYKQLVESKVLDKEIYSRILLKEYRKKFSNVNNIIKLNKRYFALNLFYISPRLFYSILKIKSKVDS